MPSSLNPPERQIKEQTCIIKHRRNEFPILIIHSTPYYQFHSHESIHIKIALQDTFLESIRLHPRRSRRGRWGDSHRRRRHLADTLRAFVEGGRFAGVGGGGERGALRLRDGTLGAGSKLLGPVEATAFSCSSGNGKVRCSSGL